MRNILLSALTTLIITLAVVTFIPQEDAQAHQSEHPVAFVIAKATFRVVDNDQYMEILDRVGTKAYGVPAYVLQHAAVDICEGQRGGTLYEDYSCSE